MSYVSLLLSLLAVDLLAAISPGPHFVLVTRTAIQRTRRQAAAVVLAFTTANLSSAFWSLAFRISWLSMLLNFRLTVRLDFRTSGIVQV